MDHYVPVAPEHKTPMGVFPYKNWKFCVKRFYFPAFSAPLAEVVFDTPGEQLCNF